MNIAGVIEISQDTTYLEYEWFYSIFHSCFLLVYFKMISIYKIQNFQPILLDTKLYPTINLKLKN